MTEVPAYLSPTGLEVLFALLGLVAVSAALLVVTSRQVVHAALWLVVVLAALAGCYLLLSAEFLAWVQVLLYVGAVVVLLLFGLMLTRAPVGRTDLDAPRGRRLLSALVALGTFGVLAVVVVDAFRGAWIDLPAGGGDAESVGEVVFRWWVLPFEALSMLLLAALIGAVALSRRGR